MHARVDAHTIRPSRLKRRRLRVDLQNQHADRPMMYPNASVRTMAAPRWHAHCEHVSPVPHAAHNGNRPNVSRPVLQVLAVVMMNVPFLRDVAEHDER
jgi:hypothetical protein